MMGGIETDPFHRRRRMVVTRDIIVEPVRGHIMVQA